MLLRKWLMLRYVRQQRSIREIAGELGRSYSYVRRSLVAYEIPLRGAGVPAGKLLASGVDRRRVVRLRARGRSLRAIGREVGVHHSTVARVLRLVEQERAARARSARRAQSSPSSAAV